jgi:hypothetical protein
MGEHLFDGHPIRQMRRSCFVAIAEKRTGADQIRRRCSLKPPCA